MSNESYASGNETVSTTSASDAPDTMSEGAKILIEAMKTNPEYFEPGGKYNWVAQQLTSVRMAGAHGISTRDREALTAAYERYVLEAAFTERVVASTLGVQEEEPEMTRIHAQGRYSFGHTDPRTALLNQAQVTHSIYNGGIPTP